MTAPLIAQLRELCRQGTARPWSWRNDGSLRAKDDNAIFFPHLGEGDTIRDLVNRDADANLIVAAVNALPALLDVAEAAQALVNRLDDSIAGADLEAWDAPYRIPAPEFNAEHDAARSALARLGGAA
jgi:hypothetical protein